VGGNVCPQQTRLSDDNGLARSEEAKWGGSGQRKAKRSNQSLGAGGTGAEEPEWAGRPHATVRPKVGPITGADASLPAPVISVAALLVSLPGWLTGPQSSRQTCGSRGSSQRASEREARQWPLARSSGPPSSPATPAAGPRAAPFAPRRLEWLQAAGAAAFASLGDHNRGKAARKSLTL